MQNQACYVYVFKLVCNPTFSDISVIVVVFMTVGMSSDFFSMGMYVGGCVVVSNSRHFLMKQQWSRWDFGCPHH